MAKSFYRLNVRVHWADTDAAGVVWFGNFFKFFEQAEDELFRSLGRTRMELIEDFDLLMPRVETSCRFRSPARAEDVLEIGIAVESITARRINYGFEIRESVTRRLVAVGGYQVACVNRGTFKAIEFPAERQAQAYSFVDHGCSGTSSSDQPTCLGGGSSQCLQWKN